MRLWAWLLNGMRRRLHPFERTQHVAKQRELRGGVEPVPGHGQPDDVRVRAPEVDPFGEVVDHGDTELVEAALFDDPRGQGPSAFG